MLTVPTSSSIVLAVLHSCYLALLFVVYSGALPYTTLLSILQLSTVWLMLLILINISFHNDIILPRVDLHDCTPECTWMFHDAIANVLTCWRGICKLALFTFPHKSSRLLVSSRWLLYDRCDFHSCGCMINLTYRIFSE